MISLNFHDLATNVSYIIENNIILGALLQRIKKLNDIVEIRDGARVDGYELPTSFTEELVKVKMVNGDVYETNLLVSGIA